LRIHSHLILVCIFALGGTALAEETMLLQSGYWLRAQPTQDGKGIRFFEVDKKVNVLQQGSGDWAFVEYEGGRYWVAKTGLKKMTNAPTGRPYVVSKDDVSVRSKPGTKAPGGELIGTLDHGAPVSVHGEEKDSDGDNWFRVQYQTGDKTFKGYIYEGLVKPDDDSATEADFCPDGKCPGAGNQNVRHNQSVAKVAVPAKGFALTSAFHTNCAKFITRGGLGEWGRAAVDAAKRIAPKCFYERKIFNTVCPGYLRMSEAGKNAFIAMMFAAIADVESDCTPSADAQGVNDVADGLFQLEYSASSRRRAGRDPQWCRTVGPTDSKAIKFQVECAVSTVEDTICSNGVSINSRDGYWQELRGNGTITRMIKQTAAKWGLCK
jgi:hypothetical protein